MAARPAALPTTSQAPTSASPRVLQLSGHPAWGRASSTDRERRASSSADADDELELGFPVDSEGAGDAGCAAGGRHAHCTADDDFEGSEAARAAASLPASGSMATANRDSAAASPGAEDRDELLPTPPRSPANSRQPRHIRSTPPAAACPQPTPPKISCCTTHATTTTACSSTGGPTAVLAAEFERAPAARLKDRRQAPPARRPQPPPDATRSPSPGIRDAGAAGMPSRPPRSPAAGSAELEQFGFSLASSLSSLATIGEDDVLGSTGAARAAAAAMRDLAADAQGDLPVPTSAYDRMQLMAAWFAGFSDAQRNDFLKLLEPQFAPAQLHQLACFMEPQMHGSCQDNCRDPLHLLPDDLGRLILSFLSPVELCTAMRVCKHWYALAETPALWRALALDRSLRMAPAAETRQVARLSHTDAAGQRRVQWRAVAAERYRLRRNWLAGRCTVRTFVGHTQSITCIQLDESRIASGSRDACIKVWSTKTNAPWSVLTLRGHSDAVRCLHMLDNQLVSGSNDMLIKVWELAGGEDWTRGSCRLTISGHSGPVRCVQADAERLISGSYDSTLKLWEMSTGKCLHTLRGHDGPVLSVHMVGNQLVSGGLDQTIKMWNLADGTCLQTTFVGHRGGVSCLQLNVAEQRIFSGSLDGDLRFWDIATGKCLETLDWVRSEGHKGVVRNIQADHWRVVSASDDKTVKVWDIHTGERLVTLQRHSGGVTCCMFNDTQMACGSYDATIKLLDFSVP